MPAQGMTLTLEMIQKGPNLMYSKSVVPNIMEVEQGDWGIGGQLLKAADVHALARGPAVPA